MRTLTPSRVTGTSPPPAQSLDTAYSPLRLWLWLAGGAVLFFLVPFLGTDVAGLTPDFYYLVYFTVAVAWFIAFVLTHRAELAPLWRHRLGTSLVVGAVAGLGVGAMVLNQAGTAHPDGARFWVEVLWRGVTYGSVDAITLFVFPAAVAYLLLRGDRSTRRRKVAFAALALALTYLVTVTYHLGYPEYRDDTMRYPLIGATIASIPTVATGNPVGAVVTHATMHTTAVTHQYNGGPQHMLPPNVTAGYPDHGSSDVAAVLAGVWMLGAAGALLGVVVQSRRGQGGRAGASR